MQISLSRLSNRILSMCVIALLSASFSVNADDKNHKTTTPPLATPANLSTAIFAGGCFWCMEKPFEKLDGVHAVVSGYTGGQTKNPTYEQIGTGKTGHREAVQITYDASKVSYDTLLSVFWKNVDPLDAKGQFCDKGFQYTSAIYYVNEQQHSQAKNSLHTIQQQLKQPITTQLVEASTFYNAEDYHQDYYKKNPVRYNVYRNLCGRDKRLKQVWGSY